MRKLSTDLIKSGSFTGSFSGSFVGLINSASYSQTASFSLNTFSLTTGSTYSITSSWSNNSISSSFSRNSISSSYSNTASNLSPVVQDLIPITGSTYSLGSATNKWKDLYVSTGSIYIGDTVLTTSGSSLYSNNSPIVTLNTASGQIEVSGITASLSASFATNAGTINNTSSNVFATTGSNTFNGSQTVQGNITVIGSLIAQQYVVSSSVSYFTSSNFDGSTKFGDSVLDTHQFTGSVLAPNITGSLLGSSSYSTTSSVALTALTSSYINIATNAVSSSYASTSSYILNAVSSSFSSTSSLANTASYILNSVSSSFASTASYNLNSVSSSYSLTSSYAANAGSSLVTGSTYPITSSWSNNSISSSYATNAGTSNTATSANSSTSASYALTASFAANAGSSLTTGSTYPITSSWSNNSVSSSYALNSSTATSAISATTATSSSFASTSSYVANTVSSSYSLTASYAMNGGSGGSTPVVSVASLNNQTILYNFSSSQEATITGLTLTNNNWGINVVEEWNSGSGDIYYSSCSLLCHFDSLNSSGSFIDNSSNNYPITSSGNAKLSTSNYKFGGASVYLDGTGDYLSVDTNVGNLGTVDWTVECWFKSEGSSGNQSQLIGKFPSATNNAWSLKNRFTSDIVSFAYYNGGFVDVNTTKNVNDGNWHHIAVTRVSTTLRIFVDGNLETTATLPASFNFGNGLTSVTTIGYNPNDNAYVAGYIDEVRVTKGIARYTASFTSPSFAFPNSATQTATKYIGLVGGLNDSNVDYGVEKLSDSSLKIKKLTDTQQPSGSFLSSSVDRVYVNVLNYTNVSVGSTLLGQTFTALGSTSSYALSRSVINPYEIVVAVDGAVQSFNDAYSVTSSTINFTETIPSGSLVDIRYLTTPNVNSASYALTASYIIGGGGTSLTTGSTYPITSSWSNNSISSSYSNNTTSASYALSSSYALNSGTTLVTGSTYPITSSWSNNSVSSSYSNISISSSFATTSTSTTSASYSLSSSYSTTATNATSATNATNSTSASYSLTSSYSVNSSTAISSSFASTASYNLNSISSSYALTASYALNVSSGGGSVSTSSVIGQTFISDGTTINYTLTQSVSNTDQILVITDGVVQMRTGSYTVSGSTLSLTNTIESGSQIDVRFLSGGSATSASFATTSSHALGIKSVNYSISNATSISVNTTVWTTIASTTITSSGKPIFLNGTGDGNPGQVGGWHRLRLYRDSTALGKYIIMENGGGSSNNCPFALTHIDVPGTGSFVYTIKAQQGSGEFTYGEEGNDQAPTLIAIELI